MGQCSQTLLRHHDLPPAIGGAGYQAALDCSILHKSITILLQDALTWIWDVDHHLTLSPIAVYVPLQRGLCPGLLDSSMSLQVESLQPHVQRRSIEMFPST